MRYLFVLVLAACIGPVQAQVVGERDPLVLGNLYLDLARAEQCPEQHRHGLIPTAPIRDSRGIPFGSWL